MSSVVSCEQMALQILSGILSAGKRTLIALGFPCSQLVLVPIVPLHKILIIRASAQQSVSVTNLS